MAQKLSVLALLLEEGNSVPSTHIMAHTIWEIWNTFLASVGTAQYGMHAYVKANTHVTSIKNKKNKQVSLFCCIFSSHINWGSFSHWHYCIFIVIYFQWGEMKMSFTPDKGTNKEEIFLGWWTHASITVTNSGWFKSSFITEKSNWSRDNGS